MARCFGVVTSMHCIIASTIPSEGGCFLAGVVHPGGGTLMSGADVEGHEFGWVGLDRADDRDLLSVDVILLGITLPIDLFQMLTSNSWPAQ
jgi:hypothetical protein